MLKSLTKWVQREFSSTPSSADLLLIILILNSAASARSSLCLFCSDLYKDGYFLLSRHSKGVLSWLDPRLCGHRLSAVPLSTYCFLLLDNLCRSLPLAAGFLEIIFLYLVCIFASQELGFESWAGWCREVTHPYGMVLIVAKGLAVKKSNVQPVPAFHRFRVWTKRS